MKATDYFYLSLKDIANFKLRSSLIILCIGAGILSSALNLYHSSKRQEELLSSLSGMGSQMISIWVQDKEIQSKDLLFLSSYFPYTSYQISGTNKIKSFQKIKKEAMTIATVPQYQAVHSVRVKDGRFISSGDIKQRRKVCVIDTTTANELKIRVGKTIRIEQDRFRVIGLVKGEDVSGQVIIPLSKCGGVIPSESRNLEVVILTPGNPDVLRKEIERILESRFPDKRQKDRRRFSSGSERFSVSTSEGLLGMIKEQKQTSRMITLGIGLITLILAGGGIINLIMLSVRQRYKEIG
ncbi:MAG: ABC transporter permease, partial [Candidatus Desantisbacteria bacterium]